MWECEREPETRPDYADRSLNSMSKMRVMTDGFQQKGKSWFFATDIPSDFTVQIGEITFHLHKYPLVSRSGKLSRLVYESREVELNKVVLDDLPGGAEAFELVTRFSYGVAIDLTVNNISCLRCAAEYLEMTEDVEEGNLIFKTEAFLSYVVLSSWRDSIVVLKSCESLSPWAEDLQIVRRCSESIAWKACTNPKGVRWHYTGKTPPSVLSPKWNENRDSSPSRVPPLDWWFEDVSILRIDHFVRVMTAIRVKGMRHELIGAVIMHYGSRWLPGGSGPDEGNFNLGASGRWKGGLHTMVPGPRVDDDRTGLPANDQRQIVESLISIIPPQRDSVSCSFMLRLVKMAGDLKVAPALLTELEKRIGVQLEQATLADLMIPCCDKNETSYDVDLLQRLLEHFLMQEQSESRSSSPGRSSSFSESAQRGITPSAKTRVARLVDSYLTEVSRDKNLSLTKFQVLAEALPESARTSDDGLYRAVDSYLKAHPNLTEHERKRLCRVMDCQKLSVDACMHVAQNERLPLRVVVQVLFAELVRVSNSLANSSMKAGGESKYQPLVSNRKTLLEATPPSFQKGWDAAKKDINNLKFEVETVKAKYSELQNELEALQRQADNKTNRPKQSSAWSIGWMKPGKFMKAPENRRGDGGIGEETMAQQSKKGARRWRNSVS